MSRVPSRSPFHRRAPRGGIALLLAALPVLGAAPLALAGDAPAAPAPEAPAVAEPPAAPKTPPPAVEGGAGKGVTLRTPDDTLSLKVQTRIVPRFDYRHTAEDPLSAGETRATINTARLWLSGYVLNRDIQYMTQLAYSGRDYRDGTISPIFDAYLDAGLGGGARLRVGQYFVRFDRLRTVREFALQMTDRPAPIADLTLDRDVGVTLYDDHLFGDESPLAGHLGVFGGRGINQLNLVAPPGGLVVGRLELRPLGPIDDDSEGDLENRVTPGLALGVGAAYNHSTNRVLSTTGATFTTGTADYVHLAADLTFKWRGLAVQGEYLYKQATEDEIISPDAEEGTAPAWTRSGTGYVAQLSYHLPSGWEAVGRYSHLAAAEGTDPAYVEAVTARTHEVGGGINYYIHGHRMKVQASAIGRYSEAWELDTVAVAAQLDASF